MDDNRHEASPTGARVNTIVLAFTVVAGMVVSLRLFVRLILTRASGIEDIWIVLAMGFSIGFAATVSTQVTHGLGKHMSQLNAGETMTLRKSFWASLWIHSLALTTTKVSILVQYLRIFPVRRFSRCCYCLLGTVLAYGAWAVASNIFICNPVAFSWDMSVEGFCLNRSLIWYTNASVNITLDLVIFLLPIPLIQRLRISCSQKRGLVIMIGLCASASLVSAIRFYTIGEVARSNDISYDNPAHATLSAVEVNAGIICACLPAMRPLLALMMPKYFSDMPDWCDIGLTPDVEQSFPHKHEPLTFRVHQDQIIPTKSSSPFPQAPRPALSRTPSGRFAVQPRTTSPPTSRRLPSSSTHSRSGSNISIDIAAADARANGPRFQGRINPLRLSPLTPLTPLNCRIPNYADSYHTLSRHASGTSSPVFWRSGTPVAVKPLPLTPLPGGRGG